MIDILVTKEFEAKYEDLPDAIKKKAEKQEKLFVKNTFHPSLNTEKLAPKGRQIWSFRVDRKYRIFFRFIGDRKVLFLTVGPHEWIYKLRFK